MSVDSKIKQLLERVNAKASIDEAEAMGAGSVKKDSTLSPKLGGDGSNPKQGSSEDASFEVRGEKDENQGSITAKNVKQNTIGAKAAPGAAPNYTTVADLTSVVNMPNGRGNVANESTEEDDEEVLSDDSEEQKVDLSSIFGEDLSEEFKTKATSIFEAAVVARVNAEMESLAEAFEEKFANDLNEAKESMVEKIDSYLNYVVENWMTENELAIENGLRTEIAEDFIQGLKTLFKEHYVEVPEEKYDVIGELQAERVELASKLDEAISTNVELNKTVVELKRRAIEEDLSKDLADTEAEKLSKLLEGVDYESEGLYREKVSVIKENYFPKKKVTESKTSVQPTTLIEDFTETSPEQTTDTSSTVSQYAAALSRTIKRS